MATSTFVVSLSACQNHPAMKFIAMYKSTLTIRDVFEEVHEAEMDTSDINVECEGHIGLGPAAGASAKLSSILIDR